MKWIAVIVAVVSCACASPKVPPLTVHAVEWNPNKVDVGRVAAVAESGEDLFIFGSTGAHVLAGGSSVATDGSVRAWRTACTIPAVDGNGTWIVAIDDKGRVLRVRDRSRLEAIGGRFGLEKSDVRSVVALGPNRVAFALDGALAIVDGDRVARHDYALSAIAGGGGFGAGIAGSELRIFDPFHGVDRNYSLDASFIAIDAKGRVVAANARAIWREEGGRMTLRYRARKAIESLATSAEKVWFRDGGDLGLLEDDRVSVTSSMHVGGALLGSPSGDIWSLADGALSRYSTVRGADLWQASIASIYTRVCSGCHNPSGSAGLDLSTPSRWGSKRAAIAKRVIVDKTMPPTGHPISDAERAAIAAWAK